MELYQLRSFLAVSQVKNLTKAAGKLNVSKSALSSQIKSLEEELKIVLFQRTSKGMVLTTHGNKLLNQAKQILNESDKLFQKARDLKNNISGTLKLGLNTDSDFLKTYLLNKQFEKLLPETEIVFLNTDTLLVPEKLRSKEIDIAFLYNTIREKDISYISLFEVDIVVAIPIQFLKNNKSPDWDELCSLPWIWTYEDCPCPFHVEMQKEFDKQNLALKKVTYAVAENIVADLVKSGQGIGMMRMDEARSLIKKANNIIIWDKCQIKIPINIAFLKSREEEIFIRKACEIIYDFWKERESDKHIKGEFQ
ncbi:MAG: LysR family transcriptional regulator [Desulfobacteraceae bacterium]|nr:LysR family transcriptional regulator [Desulfobacteraceae bacterium]